MVRTILAQDRILHIKLCALTATAPGLIVGSCAMEPSKEEMAGMDSLDKVVAWVGLTAPQKQGFYTALQATGVEHPRVLGSMPNEEFTSAVDAIRIDEAPLGRLPRRAVLLVGHISQLLAGTALAREELAKQVADAEAGRQSQDAAAAEALRAATAAAHDARAAAEAAAKAAAAGSQASAAPSAAAPGMVEMATVINQTSKQIVKRVDEAVVKQHYENFRAQMGNAPEPYQELTEDQITGAKHVIDTCTAPYLDFGVFGPNGRRLLRRIRRLGQHRGWQHAGG